jgi:4-amino-4-deoxychorismate lyase
MPSRALIPVLTAEDVIQAMRNLRMNQRVNYWSFYSSQLGGIVTDPALMFIAFDDHMVHRGHGVFDTASVVDHKIYDLDAHFERFMKSAERARLTLPETPERLKEIIIETADVGGHSDGAIRYWLSSGPGSLELSPAKGAKPGFFVMVFGGLQYPEHWYTDGLKVMTTTYPIKPSLYAITKTTNYLPNVLMQMEAKAAGLDNGVFIDADGNVGESSNMNVAFVTQDGVLRHPTFDHILSGCTSLRLLELAPELVASGLLAGVEVCKIPVADARAAREMLLIGSSIKVAPVVEWDGRPIGNGRPGPVAKALLKILERDMQSGDRLVDPHAALD